MNLEIATEFEQRAGNCIEQILAAGKKYQSEYPDVAIFAREALSGKIRGLGLLDKIIGEDLSRETKILNQRRADKLDQESGGKSVISVSGRSKDRSHLKPFLLILDEIIMANDGALDDGFELIESTHKDVGRIRQDHPDLQHFFQLYYSFS